MKKATTAITASLDAVRAVAKAHTSQLAAPAAPTWSAAQPVAPSKPSRAVRARTAKAKPQLQQCNVRLTSDARSRLRAAALACQVSEQEFIERWARTLPEPPPAPALPWERPAE